MKKSVGPKSRWTVPLRLNGTKSLKVAFSHDTVHLIKVSNFLICEVYLTKFRPTVA